MSRVATHVAMEDEAMADAAIITTERSGSLASENGIRTHG